MNYEQLSLLPMHNIFHTRENFEIKEINKNLRVITSKPIKTPFGFDSLVMSVSAKLNKNAAVLVQAAVKTTKGWSGLYKLFYISRNYKKTFTQPGDGFASVDIDTLIPKEPVQHYKYQITILGKADISLITAAITKAKAKYDACLAEETLDLTDFVLPLKPVLQTTLKDKNLAARVCSPSALTSVLNYYGKKVTLLETIQGVLDESAQIYGAWPLNAAFAAQHGLNAAVVRCNSIAQAEGEVYKGHPIIASIAYKEGKLKGASVKETKGHLVTIIGFDAKGNVTVADSAAKTASTAIMTFDRKQFARVWIKNKKGLAYSIEY
jgi:hypothetical protein